MKRIKNMQPDKFAEIIGALLTAYSKTMSREAINIYYANLKDIPEDKLKYAVNNAIRTEEYFPTVARLRKMAITDISIEEVMTELYGVMKIPLGQSFSKKKLHPATAQILDEIGGKFSLTQMTDDKLRYKVKSIYKYAIAGIKESIPQIENRNASTKSIKSLITDMKDIS